ncbi:hypothetical protein KAR91_02160 [Candidatus Pacearchaeota archaeon]|nr:hypothetical protein [Candidatus Pacearchaeota archaeon]
MSNRDYWNKRAETQKHMKSYADSRGKIFTACDECIKKDCNPRLSGSGCVTGELKEELRQYL